MVLIPVGFRANERHPSDQTTVKVFGTVRLSTPPLFAIGDQIAITVGAGLNVATLDTFMALSPPVVGL